MNTNETRDLAVKLFGLYFVIRLALYVPQTLAIFYLWERGQEFLESTWVIALASILPALLYAALSWVCLFRTRRVLALLWRGKQEADETPASGNGPSSLSFWITLVGVFYFVSSTAGLLSQLWIFRANQRMLDSTYIATKLLPSGLLFLLAVFCVLKAKWIEKFIKKKQGASPEVGQVSSEATPSASPDEPST